MCGRYAIECEEENVEFQQIIEEVERRYAGRPELSRLKTGEIFPSDTVPILASADAQPFLMNWGIPRWDSKGVVINARAESAMEKRMFRESLLAQRCVIPSTGFYEWNHVQTRRPTLFDFMETAENSAPVPSRGGNKKDKFLLRIPGRPVLYMAGFYTDTPRPNPGFLPSFIILTTVANEWVAPLHDRMPLILEGKNIRVWLSDNPAALNLLARPCAVRLLAETQ